MDDDGVYGGGAGAGAGAGRGDGVGVGVGGDGGSRDTPISGPHGGLETGLHLDPYGFTRTK